MKGRRKKEEGKTKNEENIIVFYLAILNQF